MDEIEQYQIPNMEAYDDSRSGKDWNEFQVLDSEGRRSESRNVELDSAMQERMNEIFEIQTKKLFALEKMLRNAV